MSTFMIQNKVPTVWLDGDIPPASVPCPSFGCMAPAHHAAYPPVKIPWLMEGL
jgi:hypothetical protein